MNILIFSGGEEVLRSYTLFKITHLQGETEVNVMLQYINMYYIHSKCPCRGTSKGI